MTNGPVIRDGIEQAPDSALFAARLAEIADDAPVPSPCVNICKIDPYTAACHGCRRTLDEIAAWSRMSDADKRVVWQQLPGREPPV
ncbi:MAG: DUF1289 domain-containing protein [Burkholderiaceae bacterium]|jgi:predicted Fe-S protein YdhL (DUF1289 family)